MKVIKTARASREQIFKTFLEMGEYRSIANALRAWEKVPGYEVPPYETVKKWAARHKWTERAKEYDEGILSATKMIATRKAADHMFNASKACLEAASHCHDVVIKALKSIDPKTMKAHEIKAIGELGLEMVKMREVLVGGVSDRQANEATTTVLMAQKEAVESIDNLLQGIKTGSGTYSC